MAERQRGRKRNGDAVRNPLHLEKMLKCYALCHFYNLHSASDISPFLFRPLRGHLPPGGTFPPGEGMVRRIFPNSPLNYNLNLRKYF